ncbi:restriction endonuclease subunit S [Neisseria animaloris]|uniref:restriction endonuclease subunit S n=1 Tax=Neisseria animaloris TaxID=326522 RepID=UPI000D3627F4|nr:restriction endonuclease subunit S [Neisseria animaloris]
MAKHDKQTTPRLRFQGFDGAWEEKTLGNATEIFEYGLNVQAVNFDGVHKYIRITDIDDETREFLHENLTSPDVDFSKVENYKLQKGNLLFARTGASVGKSYLYDEKDGLVYFAGFLIRAKLKKEFNDAFIFQNTLTDSFNKFIALTSQRSGQPGINAKEYSGFEFLSPALPEQTRLGNFFRELDHRIAQSRALWEKSRQLKKAMLAKMFPTDGETTPKIRFKGFTGEWERKTLGDIATIKTGISNREDSDLLGEYTFFDRSQDVRRSSRYLYDCEAVIMAGEGSEFPPKYFVGKFDLHQRSYAIMDFRECDGLFIFYYLHLMNDYFYNQAVGSTVKSLRLPMFTEMPIIVPTKAEQTAIGNFFRQLDDTIALHALETEKLGRLKKALLAAMLV